MMVHSELATASAHLILLPARKQTRSKVGVGRRRRRAALSHAPSRSCRVGASFATIPFDDDGSSNLEEEDLASITRKTNDFPKTKQQQQQPQQQQRSVLLVDDEESIRQAVGQLLTNHGYQVTTCPDGTAALQTMLQQPPPLSLDVVISDVRMPGMDGWQLLHQLRSSNHNNLKQVPVILLTAQGLPQDRVRGYQAGADAYLPKPFDPEELLALIDSVIQRRERWNGRSGSSSNTDGTTTTTTSASPLVQDLQRSVQDIQRLLLEQQQQQQGAPTTTVQLAKGGGGSMVVVHLAPPERQVLEWLCQGLRNKEIAERTFLSTRRVEQVLTTLYRKTNVKNRTELVRWAIATGTVKL